MQLSFYWILTVGYIAVIREGRKPSTKNIGLEDVGVELDKTGAIKVSINVWISMICHLINLIVTHKFIRAYR